MPTWHSDGSRKFRTLASTGERRWPICSAAIASSHPGSCWTAGSWASVRSSGVGSSSLRRLRSRFLWSALSPPHMPYLSSLSSAYSRHSVRTSQRPHIASASLAAAPGPTKKMSASASLQAASARQASPVVVIDSSVIVAICKYCHIILLFVSAHRRELKSRITRLDSGSPRVPGVNGFAGATAAWQDGAVPRPFGGRRWQRTRQPPAGCGLSESRCGPDHRRALDASGSSRMPEWLSTAVSVKSAMARDASVSSPALIASATRR